MSMIYKKRTNTGFTIVELLIVIVVIGILAAIVIVAYNGVQNRARNNSRVSEMQSWVKLFEAYRALNGKLPTLTTNTYCLGTGFPSASGGGNVPRCRDYSSTSATSFLESTGAPIITALSTVGTVPSGEKVPVGGTVGPYLQYTAGAGGTIVGWFNGGASDCPSPTIYSWTDNTGRVACYISVAE